MAYHEDLRALAEARDQQPPAGGWCDLGDGISVRRDQWIEQGRIGRWSSQGDAKHQRRDAAEDCPIGAGLTCSLRVGDELAVRIISTIFETTLDGRGRNRVSDEAEKRAQNSTGRGAPAEQITLNSPVARAASDISSWLRPESRPLARSDSSPLTAGARGGLIEQDGQDVRTINSPYCGIFCSSMMLRGRRSGTGHERLTFTRPRFIP